jgi:RHS repeat-associated protein
VYFGGKLMRSAGVTVVTDRLGSVRANSNWERMNYFPYGEERTSTADGREKFGTYFRDSGGVDYADQRYYASAGGRFLTPDPYSATASSPTDSSTPVGWNRYAYVQSDPINFRDRQGLMQEAVGNGSGELLVVPNTTSTAVGVQGYFCDPWDPECCEPTLLVGGSCLLPDPAPPVRPPPEPPPSCSVLVYAEPLAFGVSHVVVEAIDTRKGIDWRDYEALPTPKNANSMPFLFFGGAWLNEVDSSRYPRVN